MSKPASLISIAACVLATALPAAPVAAQTSPARVNHQNITVSSGAYDGRGETHELAFVHVFATPQSPWMRLRVSDAYLGKSSYIVLRAAKDGGEQRLDSKSLAQWHNATAIFNGDRVVLELHVAPGDTGVFVTFDQVIYGDPQPVEDEGGIASICGTDNRVASGDNRVGRLYFGGCTAWRTTAGVFLTAGHCTDFDPDQGGPGLPDGVLDLSGVVEFNVPASNSNGSTNAANPDDQYPILTNNVAWQFDGLDSVGTDWGAFKVGPNSNTGLTPAQAYGLPLRLTRELPAANATTRITGFGSDSGTTNFTNQTSTGPFDSEDVISGNQVQLHYQVDTEGGNSGSPVIWESMNLAFGIHTNAGCTSGGGTNAGTSMEQNTLETWISVVAAAPFGISGANTRFVDVNHPLRVSESGTPYRPYSTFNLGTTGVPNGGLVSIVAGTYTAAAGNTGTYGLGNKAMTLIAPVGTATIGQ